MINVSREFWNEIHAQDNRNYTERVEITLADSTKLTLYNEDLWNGGISIEDAVSDENSFTIGSAIINKCTISINNIYDKFSTYDFTDAKVVPYIGLQLSGDITEEIRKGTYTVDEPTYNGSLITLSCLDNMHLFDRDYAESQLEYPASLIQIVTDACQICGVSLKTTSFSHSDFVVSSRPADEAITFREVIAWCAQIAGCFARCNTIGELEINWYDQETLESYVLDGGQFDAGTSDGFYGNGEIVSGGSFNPWTTDDTLDGGSFSELNDIHHIYSNYSMSLSTDDVVITGIRVIEKTDYENTEALNAYEVGNPGYIVSIENNSLISDGNGKQIANWLGEQLIGLQFRKANITHLNDPTIEAGDIAILTDRKQNTYKILVSSTSFQIGRNQRTISAAETPAKNSSTRYSAETKNYVEYRKDLNKEKTAREKAQEELADRIENSPGLYTTTITDASGASIFYMHDRRNLEDSTIVWRMTAEAWGVSTDGGKTYNAGMTVDGDTIVRILTATGINADWINAGTLSASRISGGTLTLGGSNNTNGVLRILNASGSEVGRWNNSGIMANAGTIAGWTIRNDAMFNGIAYTGQQNSNSTGIGDYGGGWAFWAGNGRFAVTQGGHVYANDAEINGNISASSGTFNSVTINGSQINNTDWHVGTLYDGYVQSSTLQNTITNSGTISGGTYSSGNISGGTLSGSTGGTYVGTCSGSSLNSCSLNGTSLTVANGGNGYIRQYNNSNSIVMYGGNSVQLSSSSTSLSLDSAGAVRVVDNLYVTGALTANGSKNRIIQTKSFGQRALAAFETPLPTFSDYGKGRLDETGICYISIDPVFAETVNRNYMPTVFLTPYGDGKIWVEKNGHDEIVILGTPGLIFAWEVRYKQTNCMDERLPIFDVLVAGPTDMDYHLESEHDIEINTMDYEAVAEDYLYNQEHMGVNYAMESAIYLDKQQAKSIDYTAEGYQYFLTANAIDYGDEGYLYFESFERSLVA